MSLRRGAGKGLTCPAPASKIRMMRATLIVSWCLLGLVSVSPRVASAEASTRTAALLAPWPDGASGNVTINEIGSDLVQAFHVTRRGARMTIFDRDDRRYRTYYLSTSGSRIMIWDPTGAERAVYVSRGGGRSVRLVAQPNTGARVFGLRSSGAERARSQISGRQTAAAPRRASMARTLRYRIRTLDRTLADLPSTRSAIDAAVVSIVTEP